MAYKVFTNGSVLNASEINENLMNQAIAVFSNASARTAAITSPVEGQVTYLEDTAAYESFDGSSWVGFGGGGKILQVVHTAKTDTFTTTSSTFTTVTGLTATITPSSTTSKILIFGQISVGRVMSDSHQGHFKITRGGPDFSRGDAAGSRVRAVFGGFQALNDRDNLMSQSIIAQDSPASTSALTYQLEAMRGPTSGGLVVAVNRSQFDFDNADMARGASSITLMEVAG